MSDSDNTTETTTAPLDETSAPEVPAADGGGPPEGDAEGDETPPDSGSDDVAATSDQAPGTDDDPDAELDGEGDAPPPPESGGTDVITSAFDATDTPVIGKPTFPDDGGNSRLSQVVELRAADGSVQSFDKVHTSRRDREEWLKLHGGPATDG